MERLTLAALQHLPTHVLFVADLTEGCGTSIEDQWALRCELKKSFPNKAWLDVFSKADLLEDEFAAADAEIAARRANGSAASSSHDAALDVICVDGPVAFAAALPAAVRVSSLTEAGVPELQGAVLDMLAAVATQVAATSSGSAAAGFSPDDDSKF